MKKNRFVGRGNSVDREKRIYNAHNIFVIGITAILVGGSVFAYMNLSTFRSDIRGEMDLFKDNLKAEIKNDIESDLDIVREQLQDRINEEFNRENIRFLVESTAKERIDKIADELIRSKVEKVIDPKVAEINKNIENLFDKTELQLLYLGASNDSRQSFDKLKEFSLRSDYSYKEEAKMYYEKIYAEYSSPVLYYPLITADVKGVDLNKLSWDEIRDLMKKVGKDSRTVIQNEMWFDNRFSFEQKMILYKDIIKTDKSIQVIRNAAQIIINQNNLTYSPMEWDKIISFLESKYPD